MKAPVGLLSDRTVLRSKMEGLCPDKFQFVAHPAQNINRNDLPFFGWIVPVFMLY